MHCKGQDIANVGSEVMGGALVKARVNKHLELQTFFFQPKQRKFISCSLENKERPCKHNISLIPLPLTPRMLGAFSKAHKTSPSYME